MSYDAEVLRKVQDHVTFEEAARMLRITTKTLKQKIKQHHVKLHRIKGTKLFRIPQSELIKLIETIEP